jgi:SAM-dependent methyltransferase
MTQQHADQSGSTMAGPGDHWTKEEVVAAFVAQTTAQAEERRVLFEFAGDLFPFEPDARIRVLDLGAGYGAFAATVLDRFPNATAVGLDLSAPMMAVGQAFGELHHRHEGQAPRRLGRLPLRGEERREARVVVDRAEDIAHPHIDVALREGGAGDAGRLLGHGADRLGAQAHQDILRISHHADLPAARRVLRLSPSSWPSIDHKDPHCIRTLLLKFSQLRHSSQ